MKPYSFVPALLACSLPAAAVAQQAVNFVVINLDDCGNGDFSFKGAIGYNTPNIDKLAAEGMSLTNFYAVQPISGASRAGLLTGCYPNRIGFAYAPGPNSPTGISHSEETIAQVLKKKDYATAIYGKWHLGDALQFLPLQHGFDDYYGLPYSNDMWPFHPQYKYVDLPTFDGNTVVGFNTDQSRFTTDYTERSVEFIRRNADRPFFLYLAHSMPHVPLAVSDKFKGKSGQGLFGDVMMELDWSVGEVVKTLRESGIEDNTMIILTSDNGPWINYGNHAGSTGGLREAKATTFNGGVRVPCVVYWKGKVTPGTTCNYLLSNIDILPTLAQIAGAPLPGHKIDGVSMVPAITGEERHSVRDALAIYFHRNSLEAVTDGEYKLIFPHKYRSYEGLVPGNDGQPGDLGQKEVLSPELYDLRRDAGERYNVIDAYPEVAERLKRVAESFRADLGDDLTQREGPGRRPVGREDKEDLSKYPGIKAPVK